MGYEYVGKLCVYVFGFIDNASKLFISNECNQNRIFPIYAICVCMICRRHPQKSTKEQKWWQTKKFATDIVSFFSLTILLLLLMTSKCPATILLHIWHGTDSYIKWNNIICPDCSQIDIIAVG